MKALKTDKRVMGKPDRRKKREEKVWIPESRDCY